MIKPLCQLYLSSRLAKEKLYNAHLKLRKRFLNVSYILYIVYFMRQDAWKKIVRKSTYDTVHAIENLNI